MSPGPNCFTRGSSVMLLSSLTIAILQKRNESHVGAKAAVIGGSNTAGTEALRAIFAFRMRRDGASEEPKALSTPMRGCRSGGTHHHSYIYSQGRPVQPKPSGR